MKMNRNFNLQIQNKCLKIEFLDEIYPEVWHANIHTLESCVAFEYKLASDVTRGLQRMQFRVIEE